MPQKRIECFRVLLEHLAWIEHEFLSDMRDSRKAGSLWGMMWGVGGVRKSIHQNWLAKGLGLGLQCFGFKGGCRYETIEEMKEAGTMVIDTLTQDDFHGAFQKLLERYNKCIAAVGDSFEGDLSFMRVLLIKCPYEKSLKTYLKIIVYIYMCVCIYICVCVYIYI